MTPDPSNQLFELSVETVEDGVHCVATDASFWNYTSAFGGWVMGVVVRLLHNEPEFRGEVLTQQAQFLRPVAGEQLLISIELLVRRRSIDFWRVEVRDIERQLLVTVDLTAGERQATGIEFERNGRWTDLERGELMPINELRPAWMQHFDQWMIEGEPFVIAERPATLVRIRPRGDVRFDAAVLCAICDSPMPRTFFASTELVFGATVALSTHVYASEQEIAGASPEGVVISADSSVIRNNTLNQEAHVYRTDGFLLATSYQTAVFRAPTPTEDVR